jgi:hypothetical protein
MLVTSAVGNIFGADAIIPMVEEPAEEPARKPARKRPAQA